jgi:hypothetical protein
VSEFSTNVSHHRITADDITHVSADRGVAVILNFGVQLHWDSLEEFERFVDAMHGKVMANADEVDRATEAAKRAERAS